MTAENRDELSLTVVPHAEPVAVVLWGTNDPALMVLRMTEVGDALSSAIRKRGLSVRIGPREYVKVEGWSLCGAILGIFPRTIAVDEQRDADGFVFGFKATVELLNRDGGVIGGAVAICSRDEERWADRDWNQIASMAQTRAIAKSYRGSLGFIMEMAGYAATPAEEMDGIEVAPHPRQRPQDDRAPARQAAQPRDAGDKHNGVSAPPEHLSTVGHFLTYAKYHHNLGMPAISSLFDLTLEYDIPAIVAQDFAGDFDALARDLDVRVKQASA